MPSSNVAFQSVDGLIQDEIPKEIEVDDDNNDDSDITLWQMLMSWTAFQMKKTSTLYIATYTVPTIIPTQRIPCLCP